MSAAFRVVDPSENPTWPSGDSRDAALLALSAQELERRVGVALVSGTEAGLGAWSGIGLELASGVPIELVRYESDPRPNTFCLRVDAAANRERVRAETLRALGLDQSVFVWLSDDTSESGARPAG